MVSWYGLWVSVAKMNFLSFELEKETLLKVYMPGMKESGLIEPGVHYYY